ncbi:hypothetical protein COU17_00200 [Candidatus Kaiserbacteria bacterium CG10_big_fil_rev_8_21_14_0_10_49_17]|uniref:Phospholipid/glycerol acyltransferase domain-containing protein n=1 Tax=Candidatus Kaiserbacteria bacterium CG10_big_fil_rev_8_21_14_0_10_49_17 TaxID=1974609 RepID=A0A2M6WF39_9BACT|nr:MAG: hypothetical protein COU17_00200 [Candidatus Kaiserbacteria bacterium CG10_big_fil_rev_8_21_14_0_10_49_17]
MSLYGIVPGVVQALAWIPGRILIYFFTHFTVYGRENIRGVEKPTIFVSNHPNQFDPVFIRGAFPMVSRHNPLLWISRSQSVYQWKGWRKYVLSEPFFRFWGAPVAPGGLQNYSKTLSDHVLLLKRGYTFCVFPQAGDDKFDGKSAKARGGIGYLIAAVRPTVVPVYVKNSAGMSPGRFFSRKHRVSVHFGKPRPARYFLTGMPNTLGVKEYREVSERLVKAIYALESPNEIQ